MDSGAYIKFIEMHTEMRSEMAAHRQCMFIYWHRMFLLVFENMLRGQGEQFACVTVPYYNWVGAHDRVLAGTCSSIGDCSSITSELGGYTTGTQQIVNINGFNNSGRCVDEFPLNHFCQSGAVSGSACAQCVPRGDWGSRSVPASTSYASTRQQVFNSQNIGQMASNIERGCHNNVHSSLSGSMDTFAAPADPIFWSHHAIIDALHTIFHRCRVGSERLTFAQKAAHPVAWTSCARRDGGTFRPTDLIVMRTGVNGNNPIQGSEDPLIGRYFFGVPNQFAGLMDIRDLGDSSYSYELGGQLADMYNNCDGTSTTVTPTTRPSTPISTATAPPPTTAVPHPATAAPSLSTQHDVNNNNNNNVDVIIVEKRGAAEKLVDSWYNKTMAIMGGQYPEVMADLERQVCMFESECLGGAPDYSAAFKATWGVKEPRCLTIVKAIKSGQETIMYGNWRQDMESYFGCPKPANTTSSAH